MRPGVAYKAIESVDTMIDALNPKIARRTCSFHTHFVCIIQICTYYAYRCSFWRLSSLKRSRFIALATIEERHHLGEECCYSTLCPYHEATSPVFSCATVLVQRANDFMINALGRRNERKHCSICCCFQRCSRSSAAAELELTSKWPRSASQAYIVTAA